MVQIFASSGVLVQLIVSLRNQNHSFSGSIWTTSTNNSRLRFRYNHRVQPWHHAPRTYTDAPSVESNPREDTITNDTHNKQVLLPPHFRRRQLGSPRRQAYCQTSLFTKGQKKLSQKFYGPDPINRRIGEVAYELLLPSSSKIHLVFHISLLKPYHNPKPPPSFHFP